MMLGSVRPVPSAFTGPFHLGKVSCGHGPAFGEHKGTIAEGSRAADRLCKNLELCNVAERGIWRIVSVMEKSRCFGVSNRLNSRAQGGSARSFG